MSVTCNICGTASPDGARFCEGCGVELAPAAPVNIPPDPSQFSPVAPPPPPPPVVSPVAPAQPEVPSVVPPVAPPVAPANPGTPVGATVVLKAPAPAPAPVAPQAPAALAKLLVKRFGALTGDEIPLQGTRLIVGRFDPSSGPVDIDVTGLTGAEHVSRRHAELFSEGAVWKVRDLGSTNGVFVRKNGESAFAPRLQDAMDLHDGDEVAFGNAMFIFREG